MTHTSVEHGIKLVVLILQYGGPEHTIECLESLQPQLGAAEVVVVDNASPKGFHELHAWLGSPALERIDALGRTYRPVGAVHLLRAADNLGYGAGNNLGAAYAFGELDATHLWVLNNDTRLAPDALEQLQSFLITHPDAELVGHTLLDYGTTRIQALAGARYDPLLGIGRRLGAGLDAAGPLPTPAELERNLDYVIGASFVLSRRLYERIGLFDPALFLYFEEIDLARRAARVGVRPRWAPLVRVEHKEGASISPQAKSVLSEYHATLSSLIVTRKHYLRLLPLTALIRSLYKLPRYVFSGRWPLVRAHLVAIRTFLRRTQ